MKTVEYVPMACKGEKPAFEGKITLRVPTFDERMDMMESLDVDISDDGKVERGGNLKTKMSTVRLMVKNSEKYYSTVFLKNLETGEELKTLDDMKTDPDAHAILIEVAGWLLKGGLKVGNG